MKFTTTLLFGFLIVCNSAQANINQGERTKIEQGQPRVPQCTFRGRQYLPGEVWHANGSSPHCVMCTCLQTGKLNCTNLECCGDDDSGGESSNVSVNLESATLGVTESNSKGTNACCETCGRRSSAMRSSTIQTISQDERDSNSHYDDEETDDDPLVKANSEDVSCLHQGKIYRDREVFAANMSGLPISSRRRDHCIHCVCQRGMVLCNMTRCSGFDCGKNLSSNIMKACCEKCNADRQSVNMKAASESGQKPKSAERSGLGDMNDIADTQYLYTSTSTGVEERVLGSGSSPEENHFIVNHRLLAPTKRAGCVSAGKFHFHGSTWHPVIGPFGPMECVICKCLHSRIECSRLPCPPAVELQCSTLVKLEGHCCPTCIFPPASENTPRKMCVPVYQDVTVYKSQEYFPENETEFMRLSFVRVNQGNWNPKFQVEVHEWTLAEGKIFRFYTTYFTIEDFLKSQDLLPGVIVGATTSRNLEKFTKREKKLHFRCKASCSVRIQGLQLTLRLHELVAKQTCSSQERSVL